MMVKIYTFKFKRGSLQLSGYLSTAGTVGSTILASCSSYAGYAARPMPIGTMYISWQKMYTLMPGEVLCRLSRQERYNVLPHDR